MTNIYKDKLSKIYKSLDKEEQIDLCGKMKTGDIDARNSIINSCLPLVIHIAKKFRRNNKHIDLEDMIQEGNITLIKVIDKWDVEKGSISTYATRCITNSLIDMITDARYHINYPYSLSRRAAEELRKINNVDSTDIEHIAKETGLTQKRVKKLLSIYPKGMRRYSNLKGKFNEWGGVSFLNHKEEQEEEDLSKKPCIGDLISLINTTLDGDQKTIYSMWAGINTKKIGKKQIAISLGKTEQYVYDNIKNATRLLSKAAKKVNTNA